MISIPALPVTKPRIIKFHNSRCTLSCKYLLLWDKADTAHHVTVTAEYTFTCGMLSWLFPRPVREWHRLYPPGQEDRIRERTGSTTAASDILKAIRYSEEWNGDQRRQQRDFSARLWNAPWWRACWSGGGALCSGSTWDVMCVGWCMGRDAAASHNVKGDEHKAAHTGTRTFQTY